MIKKENINRLWFKKLTLVMAFTLGDIYCTSHHVYSTNSQFRFGNLIRRISHIGYNRATGAGATGKIRSSTDANNREPAIFRIFVPLRPNQTLSNNVMLKPITSIDKIYFQHLRKPQILVTFNTEMT